MRFREFEELAFAHWDRIPDEYREGIDGVRVMRRAHAHGDLPDVYTMGECVTESYPSDYGGPDTIRSAVVLYYGSFAALAEQDDDFDWEGELWETLTHELRHHLESLAAEDALEGVDYAADENFKRSDGESYDPLFYRSGERVAPEQSPRLLRIDEEEAGRRVPAGARVTSARPLETWRVEGDWFAELAYTSAQPPSGGVILEWLGARHAVEIPALDADVTFAVLGGGFEPPEPEGRRIVEATLVLLRRRTAWGALLDALRGRTADVREIELDATPLRGEADAPS